MLEYFTLNKNLFDIQAMDNIHHHISYCYQYLWVLKSLNWEGKISTNLGSCFKDNKFMINQLQVYSVQVMSS